MNLFGLGGKLQQHKQAQAGPGRSTQQKPPADDTERLEGFYSLAWVRPSIGFKAHQEFPTCNISICTMP